MKNVKFLVIEFGCDEETLILCEDGGVASPYHNQDHMLVDLYQSRITPETDIENMYDILAEGKMYVQEYKEHQEVHPVMIQESIAWLYTGGEDYLPVIQHTTADDIHSADEYIKDWLTKNYNDED